MSNQLCLFPLFCPHHECLTRVDVPDDLLAGVYDCPCEKAKKIRLEWKRTRSGFGPVLTPARDQAVRP